MPFCLTIITIIHDFYNSILINPLIRGLEPAIYIRFGVTAILLLSGLGNLLSSFCPLEEEKNYNTGTPSHSPLPQATSKCRSNRQWLFQNILLSPFLLVKLEKYKKSD